MYEELQQDLSLQDDVFVMYFCKRKIMYGLITKPGNIHGKKYNGRKQEQCIYALAIAM